MKKVIKNIKPVLNRFPIAYKFVFAIVLFAISLIISTLINQGVVKAFFPYTAVILLGLATYILFEIDNKSLNGIGLNFKLRNISFLLLGILIGALTLLVANFVKCFYTGESFVVSNSINYSTTSFITFLVTGKCSRCEIFELVYYSHMDVN